MHISRIIKEKLINHLNTSNKIILIYGARQIGKTTLINEVLDLIKLKSVFINGDELKYHQLFASRDSNKLNQIIVGYDLLFIDEAQRLPEIGLCLKILKDGNPKLKIIVTGSSSLELARGLSEPLTGRKYTYNLYGIASIELLEKKNKFELAQDLENGLIWGSYPEIFSIKNRDEKIQYLREITSDYLYRDVLELVEVRASHKIKNLLQLLAFQIGNEVSLNELSGKLDLSKETVDRYIDLLEKCFVLFRLNAFSRNLRNEIGKNVKYYFWDLGVRNTLIDNFKPLNLRDDVGGLFENFMILERIKFNSYKDLFPSNFFWRTYSGSEIDYLEESQSKIKAYEFKYSKSKARKPKAFLEAYPNSTWEIINKENWLSFVLGEV